MSERYTAVSTPYVSNATDMYREIIRRKGQAIPMLDRPGKRIVVNEVMLCSSDGMYTLTVIGPVVPEAEGADV